MKSPDEIYYLIRSLTKEEKRYIKVYASRHVNGKNNNSIKLLNQILARNKPNEQELKLYFKQDSIGKNFAETKYQLHQFVLKSLAVFHIEKSPRSKLRQWIHQTEIMVAKARYHSGATIVKKAKKVAIHNELFLPHLELLNLELTIGNYNESSYNSSTFFHEIMKEQQKTRELFNNYSAYHHLGQRIYLLHVRIGVVRNDQDKKELDIIMSHDLIENPNKAKSIRAMIWYIYCYRVYGHLVQDNEIIFRYGEQFVQLLDDNPQFIADDLARYFGVLHTIAMYYQDKKQEDLFKITIEKCRSLPQLFPKQITELNKISIFQYSNQVEISYYVDIGKFEQGLFLLDIVDEGLKKYEDKMLKNAKFSLLFFAAMLAFGAEQFERTNDYINLILDDKKDDTSLDIQSFARILLVITHFELDNSFLLPYVLKSTYRFLHKRKRLYQVETSIIKYLRKAHKLRSKNEIIESFKGLKDELILLSLDKHEKLGLEYFDIISWLEAKIQSQSFSEIVQKKAALKWK